MSRASRGVGTLPGMAGSPKRPRGKARAKTPVPKSSRPQEPDSPRRRQGSSRVAIILVPVLAVLLAIGIGILLGVRSSRSADDIATPPVATTPTTETAPTTTAVETAKELFGHTCATCHTLAAAAATGDIGPNLDEIKPSRARVLAAIRNGSLSGAMPANLLTGDDAQRVAAYVSGVAGR